MRCSSGRISRRIKRDGQGRECLIPAILPVEVLSEIGRLCKCLMLWLLEAGSPHWTIFDDLLTRARKLRETVTAYDAMPCDYASSAVMHQALHEPTMRKAATMVKAGTISVARRSRGARILGTETIVAGFPVRL
jgi:hypothetical protein